MGSLYRRLRAVRCSRLNKKNINPDDAIVDVDVSYKWHGDTTRAAASIDRPH